MGCFSFRIDPSTFLPEEGSVWVGSPSYCLVDKTKLDRLNVKTRTFVLEIIHEVLMCSCRAYKMLSDSFRFKVSWNPFPFHRYVWAESNV